MAKYQQYSEYKDSGVEWLGEVPSHWGLSSLKRCVDGCTNGIWGSEPEEGSNNTIVLRVADFDRNKLEVSEEKLTLRNISPKESESRLLKKGDLLIEKSGGGDKTLVGCVVVFDKDFRAVTSNFVAKMTPKIGYESRFLKYAFSLLYDGRVNYASIKQTTGIQNLDSDAYLMEKFVFPEKEEQTQIAKFLDHETAQIDTLIEKQQTLIQLLKEKRQAGISHAVTKGLNPDSPMKDSGVEWLGEVPEHWEVKRVRHAFDIDNNLRTPINRQARSEMEGEFRYYGPTGVLNLINRYNVEGQYFLLGEDGDHFLKFEEKPMTIYVEGKFNVNNHAHLIKGKGACSTKWGCLYFEHKDLFPWLIKQGVGRYKLQKTVLLDIPIAIPPLDEQEFILNAVNKKKNNFSEIERRTEALINLLKERRTALISAAVTGKIDVRGWQVPEAS